MRIELMDIDRLDEPLAVDVEDLGDLDLSVIVPNTSVRFTLYRRDREGRFEGALGGRYFVFDPASLSKARPAPEGKTAKRGWAAR